MPYPGGIADKAGNTYEAKWCVRQLLDVLIDNATLLQFESIDPADRGFDFSVVRDSFVEHHQAKIKATDGNWTIALLGRQGVLGNFAAKLASAANTRCVFVSQSPAPALSDLVDKVVLAQSIADFEQAIGVGARGDFENLSRCWSCAPATAFD